MTFRVLVDDNYHNMDQSARTTLGEFDTLEASVPLPALWWISSWRARCGRA